MIDGPFGPIQIDYDPWPSVVARIHGPGIPAVIAVPDRRHGRINFGGHSVPTSQNRSRWNPRRKSRAWTAVVGERTYELRPTTLRRAEVRRNGTVIARASSTLRSYSPGSTIPGRHARLTWSQGLDPTDVAIAQALVLTFGAGAPGALLRIFFFWYDNVF
ncbi:hypothetical protein [Streptomyces sp. NRRL WC-3742]|uniref:hypothetical protein n=1 Tax=Streptomyces sp. NRRL WC-3742 TaxID=1463934 RepID=UPI0004CA4DE8|nr:hypothetical protein [Streptomyces sp. NRRL WC-3742]